uniref:Uncharacterized protein n=1 Tax=Chlamydomonas leiostraca TaxID=1034604 RepID=A0A7S0X3B7_9CHLO|eukprot:CAMPEP_0202858112 /NCGR_PEP_ID=MMETSP1391-20130828/782_1 /ASSEMBLY_ACC=CAM_ASM_000867 /TAXON_ID=1034604 /ORGANISM="Chlamydomonas leiostraca, Strain SAG 11-49" /LENGTH=93 /DNA_ID=CAMNT_0049536995 /DNA_START=47 /DNA_END=328 /DNA_ORIENTATION=-
MATSNPVLLLFLPSIYIAGALAALLQFQVLFTLAMQGFSKVKTIEALAFAKPGVMAISDYLIKVFGQPHKFVPQPTHVLLVALILAVVVHSRK